MGQKKLVPHMRNLVLPVTASESTISSEDDTAATGTESFDILSMAFPAVVGDIGALVVVGSSPEPDPSNTWLKLLTLMNLAIPLYGRLMLS